MRSQGHAKTADTVAPASTVQKHTKGGEHFLNPRISEDPLVSVHEVTKSIGSQISESIWSVLFEGCMTNNVVPIHSGPRPAPRGFRWVYFKSFIHWRSKKRVFRKNGGMFCILVRAA